MRLRQSTRRTKSPPSTLLRVADHHTYFVGGEVWGWDVWVHNASYATETNSRTITFRHRLKPNKTTDVAALRQEIQLHVESWNDIIRKEGMQGLKQRLRQYEQFGTQIEAAGRRYTKGLGSAGKGKAWPHYPDMSTGGRPKSAVGSPADRRLNSIIGGQTDRLRREILNLPDNVTQLRFDLDLQ